MKKRNGKKIPAHTDRLYKAVANYVEKCGGKLILIGGVQIQQWPGDSEFKFTIGIPCLGQKPTYANDTPTPSPKRRGSGQRVR